MEPANSLPSGMADELVRAMMLVLSNIAVYGIRHGVTRKSLDACYAVLVPMLATGEVPFALADTELSIRSLPVEQKNKQVTTFIEHLKTREIANFTFRQGLSAEQFDMFIEVLSAQPHELKALGDFSGTLAAVGLADVIGTRKVVLREVAEDEEVVARGRLEALSEEAVSAEKQAEKVQSAVAYLRGDAVADEQAATANVRDLCGDADSLAELILQLAKVRRSSSGMEEGESLGDIIVGCLHRLFKAMEASPGFNTQKGRAQARKVLLQLETAILDLIQGVASAGDASAGAECNRDAESVRDVIEEMKDELEIDALAKEYVRRRLALEASEKRILRFIRNKGAGSIGDAGLKERLIGEGLTLEDWRELLVKSGLDMPEPPAS